MHQKATNIVLHSCQKGSSRNEPLHSHLGFLPQDTLETTLL